jgi:succinate dehydrogenase/fumarate reductase cytochrome b subunit
MKKTKKVPNGIKGVAVFLAILFILQILSGVFYIGLYDTVLPNGIEEISEEEQKVISEELEKLEAEGEVPEGFSEISTNGLGVFVKAMLTLIGIFHILVGIILLIASAGIWKAKRWARILSFIMLPISLFFFPSIAAGIISLILVPVLLIATIFAIWYLAASKDAKKTFRK